MTCAIWKLVLYKNHLVFLLVVPSICQAQVLLSDVLYIYIYIYIYIKMYEYSSPLYFEYFSLFWPFLKAIYGFEMYCCNIICQFCQTIFCLFLNLLVNALFYLFVVFTAANRTFWQIKAVDTHHTVVSSLKQVKQKGKSNYTRCNGQ